MTEGTEGEQRDEREERDESTPQESAPQEPAPQAEEAADPTAAGSVDEPVASAGDPDESGSWADVVDETVEEPAPSAESVADDSATDDSATDDSATDDERETAGASAGAGGPTFDEQARQFMGQVEGFLGNVFRDASKVVGKVSERVGEERTSTRRTPPAADPRDLIDSVEGWVGDFFRGTPASRAAAGFGRAAVGSAFRSQTRRDDVWSSATTAEEGAARECKYCPFCQTLSAVRNTRPDLYEQIGDTAKTLVHLVRQAAEQSGRRPRQ